MVEKNICKKTKFNKKVLRRSKCTKDFHLEAGLGYTFSPSSLVLRLHVSTALLFNKLETSDLHEHIHTQPHGHCVFSFENTQLKITRKTREKFCFKAAALKKNWKIVLSRINRLGRNVCIFVGFMLSDVRESQFDI